MDCPFCGYDIDKGGNKIGPESGWWKTTFQCPNCMRKFKKKTILNRGVGYAAKASVWALVAALLSETHGGECDEVVWEWEEVVEIDTEMVS
jgi:hypothetical protein